MAVSPAEISRCGSSFLIAAKFSFASARMFATTAMRSSFDG
jgi:hypothetical protein